MVVGTALLLTLKSTVAFTPPSTKLTAAAAAVAATMRTRSQQQPQQQQQSPFSSTNSVLLWLAEPNANTEPSASTTEKSNKLPFWLDPGTKGGAVVLTIVLFVVPLLVYQFVTNVFGFDEIEAGKWIGIGFTLVAMLGWVSTYIFRVATKDMTYVSI